MKLSHREAILWVLLEDKKPMSIRECAKRVAELKKKLKIKRFSNS